MVVGKLLSFLQNLKSNIWRWERWSIGEGTSSIDDIYKRFIFIGSSGNLLMFGQRDKERDWSDSNLPILLGRFSRLVHLSSSISSNVRVEKDLKFELGSWILKDLKLLSLQNYVIKKKC